MRRLALGAMVVAMAAMPACGSPPKATAPTRAGASLARPFVAALRTEATGDQEKARALFLELAGEAARTGDAWGLAAAQASLDALVYRDAAGLEQIARHSALADRTGGDIVKPLARHWDAADDPFVKGLYADALTDLAERAGDATRAEQWRAASGCARAVTIVGPLDWAPVSGVAEADPLERFDAPLAPAYAAPGAFAAKAVPVVASERGCAVDVTVGSVLAGVRDVVIDVPIDRAQTIAVAMWVGSEAALRVGGRPILRRPYDLGSGFLASYARVDVSAGVVRIVARVGVTDDGERVKLAVWDARGKALASRAPQPGSAGTARATGHAVVALTPPKTDDERALAAAAALANHDARTAERGLFEVPRRADAPPELSLIYARAVDGAPDLDAVHRMERSRAAYERVLEKWPGAWEAVLAHAVLAGARRGQTEARIETLLDLEARRAKVDPAAMPLVDAFEAGTAGHDDLHDRARAAFARARAGLTKGPNVAPLLRDVDRAISDRTGAERVDYECGAGRDMSDFGCYDARAHSGDHAGASVELARLRAVHGTPRAWLALELRKALAVNDSATATRAFGAMLPGERTLSFISAMGGAGKPATRASLTDLFSKTVLTARDAPHAFGPLLRAAEDDPVAAMDHVAEALAAEDRKSPIMPGAATAVLVHKERYDVDASGVVHAVMLDVRRVTGTRDVEENAQATPPEVTGRTAFRVLRRRVLKKDGRILQPERTPHAAQAHADLAQLEAGDVVEAIYETWAIPGETGDITIDTPDLLPERTAVHEAVIELALPKSVRATMWSHPMLGKPQETEQGGVRLLRFVVKDHADRRLESGTPKMDQSVSVSLSTAVWSDVGRALKETLAALDDHEPEVTDWAQKAAKGQSPRSLDLVRAVVLASGDAVKEGSAALLADIGLGRPRGERTMTARTILATHEGSRTWLVARALRELGVSADVVVAEDEPYSADPHFPPHFGRFMHPLVVAHLEGGREVWIDADVAGPPLPAGRISPHLRGRAVLKVDGSVGPVTATFAEERDEIDLRLTVDGSGNAKGSFTILLRGREAQELAEALFRIVGSERQRALRNVVLGWVPHATVEDVALSSSEGSWQVAVRAAIAVSGFAQADGATAWLPGIEPLHYVYPRPFATTLGATYAHQGGRENALAIGQTAQYHVHRRVDLPKGAEVTRAPSAFAVKTGALTASRTIAVAGPTLEDDFVLDLPTGTVPPEGYGAFVKNAHRTDDAFGASTRVKLPK